MIKCGCGVLNPDGANYCQECGVPIFDEKTPIWVKEQKLREWKKSQGYFSIKGKGLGGLLKMTNNGLESKDYRFIPYTDVISIEERIYVGKDGVFALGLVGAALDAGTKKSVEIETPYEKVVMGNVGKEEAVEFVLGVRKKIFELKKNKKH